MGNMKTIKTDKSKNLQVPGEKLTDFELAKLVKEAQKGPFLTIQEHQEKMTGWIKENSR